MFTKIIHTSFAPNVEKDDLLLSLKLLFGFSQKEKKTALVDIEKEFSTMFDASYAISFSSGRAALYNILKSLDLSDGDEILLQAFTCVAVPNAVLWAGLKPVYVDIDKITLNINVEDLSKKITKKSRAIIVQHTFGIPAGLDKILEIAKKHNLIVIEDCAHALGGTYKNKLLGTYGDVAFFSFGRDKMISSVFGGTVITNNVKIGEELKKHQSSLKKPSTTFVIKQLLYAPIYALSLFLYDVYIGKLILKIASGLNILTKAVFAEEKMGGKPEFIYYSFDASLALLVKNQLKKLEKFTDHRKKIASLYEKKLSHSFTTGQQPLLRYPLEVPDKKSIIDYCKNKNIHLGNWYQTPIDPRGVSLQKVGYELGLCPNAEDMCKKIINLPTHINVAESNVENIVKTINDYSRNNQ